MGVVRLIDEDFSSFDIGFFPHDYSAVGEYHFRPPAGYRGIWREPNRDTSWGGKCAFFIRSIDGVRYAEQSIDNEALLWPSTTCPLLAAGDAGWEDYTLAAEVTPLNAARWAGIGFRYRTARSYYLFALDAGAWARLYRKDGEALEVVAECEWAYRAGMPYALSVEVRGREVRCRVDGAEALRYDGLTLASGNIAISAWEPARFTSVALTMTEEAFEQFTRAAEAKRAVLLDKQKKYPPMRLARVIDFQDFGTARSLRFGDLTGDGALDMLLIQPEDALNNHDEMAIGCMTAIDLRGTMLWQIGEPRPGPHIVCKDMPAQIFDIDGDGRNEVIYTRDFKLIVADGATGRTKYFTETPHSVYTEKFTIARNVGYARVLGDSIGVVFPEGRGKPASILVKDRYNNLWLYDQRLNFRWHHSLNTGHFPISAELDGEDAIIAGHSLIVDGEIRWTLENRVCHTDEIIVGDGKIIMASGEDGLLVCDYNGRLLFQDEIGHAQRISLGNYRPDLPGLELCAVTFWRNASIITMYDRRFQKLFENERCADGNIIAPVDWLGDGSDLLLYSASAAFGGLYDGHGELAVPFPLGDAHPEQCCEALDLLWDSRDELLAWDEKRMYIYTQADNPRRGVSPPGRKCPHYNASNYRGEYNIRS